MGSNDRSFSFFISFFSLHREVIYTTKYDSRRAQKERTVYRYTLEMIEGAKNEERHACQLSIKTRNRVGKRVEGCSRMVKRIERIHHPCSAETAFDIPSLLPFLLYPSSSSSSSSWSFHRSAWNLYLFSPPFLILDPSVSLPASHPRTLSSVSDRVPLFRVLYYFFYQSARFQDALRPVESCVINHEM